MDTYFEKFLAQFDPVEQVTEEEVEKTERLLRLYAPAMRRCGDSLMDVREECMTRRQQEVADFINLAIDFDRDAERKRVGERLSDVGRSMSLMKLLEDALFMLKGEPKYGMLYYKILSARYFDAYCHSNEDAFLNAGISSATYYRHIRRAIRLYAAMLWRVVIPDLVMASERENK